MLKHSNAATNIFYILYIILMFVICIRYLPVALENSYNGLLFPASINYNRLYVSGIVSIILFLLIKKRYSKIKTVSDAIMLLLVLLYFLPGIIICGVCETDKMYFVYYLTFLFFTIFFERAICFSEKFLSQKISIKHNLDNIFTILILIIALFFIFFFDYSFSISKLIIAATDVYGVRADASDHHWFFFTLEQWSVYFGAILITYSLKKNRWKVALALIICEIFFFTMQANKIDIFVTIFAIILGCKNINTREIAFCSFFILVIIFIECLFFDQGLIATNIFRRFSIVPNRISTCYYDYFQTHSPDFLRSVFTRINYYILGISSQYPNIAHTIGETYFYKGMGANTGMIAPGFYAYGNWGILIESFCIVVFIKIINSVCKGINSISLKLVIAIIFTVLLINLPFPLANLFKLSYVFLLVLSIFLFRQYLQKV